MCDKQICDCCSETTINVLSFLSFNLVSTGFCGVAFYTANANRKAKQGAKSYA
jgi:hypothetical protein